MKLGRRIAPLVVLVFGVCVAFGSALLPSRILQIRDHRAVFYGRWWWVQESLSNFELPTRTLASSTNVPLESLLNGTYTPMTLILFLFDFKVAYDLFVAAHVLLGCVGVYMLARALGAQRDAALLASAFGFAGPIISFENLLVSLQGVAWIPWTLFAVLRFVETRKAAWLGAMAFFAAFHLQGVMPETALLDIVAGLFLLAYARSKGTRLDVPVIAGLCLGGALAIGIASIEMMPVLEGLRGTSRGTGFSLDDASGWAVHPVRYLELWLPVFFHSPDLPFVQFPDLIGFRNYAPYMFSLYLGVGLPFPFLAVLSKNRRTRVFAGVLFVMALMLFLISAGPLLPFYGWVHGLPILSNGRYPVKFLVLATCALAALAPAGYEVLKTRGRFTTLVFIPGAIIALATLRVLGMPEVRELIEARMKHDSAPGHAFGIDPSTYVDHAIASMQDSATHAFVAIALAVVVSAVARRVPAAWPIFVVVVVLDLSVAARREIVAVPAFPDPPSELVASLANPHYRYYSVSPGNRFAKVTVHDDETPIEAQLRDANSRGENVLGYARLFDDQNNDAQSHPASALGYRLLQRSRGDVAFKMLARAGVAKLISYAKPPTLEGRRYEIAGGEPQWVVDIPGVRDYAMVHARWAPIEVRDLGRPDIKKQLGDETFSDLAFVTSGPIDAPSVMTSTGAAQCRTNSKVVVREDEVLNLVELDVELACPSLVSILEVRMPGWRATLDGRAAQLHDTDFGFISVRAEPGKHHIVFEYVPATTRWAWVALFSALAALSLIAATSIRRRVKAR